MPRPAFPLRRPGILRFFLLKLSPLGEFHSPRPPWPRRGEPFGHSFFQTYYVRGVPPPCPPRVHRAVLRRHLPFHSPAARSRIVSVRSSRTHSLGRVMRPPVGGSHDPPSLVRPVGPSSELGFGLGFRWRSSSSESEFGGRTNFLAKKGRFHQNFSKNKIEAVNFDFLAETLNRKMHAMGCNPSAFKKMKIL